ncbi:ribosome biogenesis factor YjgA [Aquabacterium sp.]|uniref:ribosome biogenesis factor YjgA n=1 Tax=Aquabacterium sp. TaxID=1872578 RepID=UPI0035AF1964
MHDPDDSFEPEAAPRLTRSERPSRTQRKKASHELQDLGEHLVRLPESRLADIEMPESLRDAIEQYKATRSFEGKRRQMQYIGKLMRAADPEPIREAVAAFELGTARNALALHQAELWRSELIRSDEAVTRWADEFPGSDVQQLRTLIRSARKDAAEAPEKRSGRGFRELFQFVKAQLESDSSSTGGSDHRDDDVRED